MSYRRKLEVTIPGRWYIALTIALGVVALTSGNNVLYLIESLLLSGLILSGVLSERTIAGVDCSIRRIPATAGSPAEDQITLTNTRNAPLFCVEVGEWREKEFFPIAYIPLIPARRSARVVSHRIYETRGTHAWQGLGIATSYPFGFARKVRFLDEPGERLVWPKRADRSKGLDAAESAKSGMQFGQDIADGEVRPFTQDDDCRMIIWTLSSKGTGPQVRVRRSDRSEPQVTLDLRGLPGPDFEKKVMAAAQPFHEQQEASETGTLVLIGYGGKKRITGKIAALNRLAMVQAESA